MARQPALRFQKFRSLCAWRSRFELNHIKCMRGRWYSAGWKPKSDLECKRAPIYARLRGLRGLDSAKVSNDVRLCEPPRLPKLPIAPPQNRRTTIRQALRFWSRYHTPTVPLKLFIALHCLDETSASCKMISLTVSAVLLAAALARAELIVVEAGTNGRQGPVLTNGFRFCPTGFSKSGFNVECRVPGARSATFYLDGDRVRKERFEPFMLNGDFNGKVFSWDSYPRRNVTIKCVGNNRVEESVFGSFSCPENPDTRKPVSAAEPSSRKKGMATISEGPAHHRIPSALISDDAMVMTSGVTGSQR